MRLIPGSPAPRFATTDFLGTPVDLAAFRGRRVLVSFYRYASCPLCNLRVHNLIEEHGRLRSLGLEMIAVFQSTAESVATHAGRQDAPFPIVADPTMELYRRFGVEARWSGLLTAGTIRGALSAFRRGFLPGQVEGPFQRIPADFLIAADGTIARAYYGRDISDHLDLAEIERWLIDTPSGVLV